MNRDYIIKQQINTNKRLIEVNLMLKAELKNYEDEEKKFKFCIKCHLNFTYKEKDDQLCIHHPGELKYYSCKGCGGDEYYTCCLRCLKCSKGCKKAKHLL